MKRGEIWKEKKTEERVLIFDIEYDAEAKENVVLFIELKEGELEKKGEMMSRTVPWEHMYRKHFLRYYKYTGKNVKVFINKG